MLVLGGVNMLLGPLYVQIQVVRKVCFFVLKRSAFEPRSQLSNPKKDPGTSGREINRKLPNMYTLRIRPSLSSFLTISRPGELGSFFGLLH